MHDDDVYSADTRARAARLRADGASWSAISRALGVSRSALRDWDRAHKVRRTTECARCDEGELDESSYSALLGYYLGDGCVSRAPRYFALRVSCDQAWPGIIEDVSSCIQLIHPSGRIFHVRAPGCIVVTANWNHWPCLLPQHGPGHKHKRPIVLEDWQRRIIEHEPAAFLRGLFHSDGCRVINTTRRQVGGETQTYHYPRWQFVNASRGTRCSSLVKCA